jgi:prepilin-type N-terminal cleavage/methylation domain-containing protein
MSGTSRSRQGFSLIEVTIGMALLSVAIMTFANLSVQLLAVRDRYAAQSRLDTTVANLATDLRAALRYDGTTAQALRAGLFPASFIVFQWEPDLNRAPATCAAQHLTEPINLLQMICSDRRGLTVTRDIPLDQSQPVPGSLVTAPPPTP